MARCTIDRRHISFTIFNETSHAPCPPVREAHPPYILVPVFLSSPLLRRSSSIFRSNSSNFGRCSGVRTCRIRSRPSLPDPFVLGISLLVNLRVARACVVQDRLDLFLLVGIQIQIPGKHRHRIGRVCEPPAAVRQAHAWSPHRFPRRPTRCPAQRPEKRAGLPCDCLG